MSMPALFVSRASPVTESTRLALPLRLLRQDTHTHIQDTINAHTRLLQHASRGQRVPLPSRRNLPSDSHLQLTIT
jgi:hypothetical protein